MKMKNKSIPWKILLIGACTWALHAEVTLAPAFSDNAVLQRETGVPVWGKADPGEKISVSFKGQKKETKADAAGNWQVILDKMPASADPAELTVQGDNQIVLKNIVVGDVWLCGGQSNMAWYVKDTLNAEEEVANSANPLIRHNAAPRRASSTAQDEIAMTGWQLAGPETTGRFTATGYYTGRELQKELGIPIGLLNISYGGTQVEAWMSPEAIDANPQCGNVRNRWAETLANYPAALKKYEALKEKWEKDRAQAKKDGKPFKRRAPMAPPNAGTRYEPSSLYNAMLHPNIPYAIAGILWYQGEANAARHQEYADLIKGLIKQWRKDFGQGDVPFIYVELANFGRRSSTDPARVAWAYQREAQRGALSEPNSGFASAIDIGETANIHPKNKQEVGRRLALNALALKYGRAIETRGPEFAQCTLDKGVAIVRFTHAEGMYLKNKQDTGFCVAGDDGVFHPAKAEVDGDTVRVWSDEVDTPKYVRYLFENDPKASLYNAAGLPAAPFRTDKFPQPVE